MIIALISIVGENGALFENDAPHGCTSGDIEYV